jgi:NDP-sugar pyrophosphorylase family protein
MKRGAAGDGSKLRLDWRDFPLRLHPSKDELVSSLFPPRGDCLRSTDVLVLAGGLGTRIRSVLGELPKVLAPIAGEPYLSHLLAWLRQFGAGRVVLGLGHRSDAVLAHLTEHAPSDIAVETIVEPRPLGTAGAIRFCRASLRSDPALVVNGDSFADADLCAMIERHHVSAARGTMLCAKVADAGRYGRVDIDAQGLIRGFVEKDPTFHGTALINAGISALSAALLDEIAAGAAVSLERDVFEHLPAGTLAAFITEGDFIDIGTPESLAVAGQIIGARTR